jgi:FKBP-type peptidyl-prolyl cis-trans isomerase
MTQTMNDKENNNAVQRRGRPGQRQQERLERLARRRRRRQIILATSIAVVLIALGLFGFLEYQQITAQQQLAAQKLNDQHATATAKVVEPTQTVEAKATATAAPHATATALSQAVLTATSGSPTPKAGPTLPPSVSGKPVTTSDGLKYLDIKEGTGATVKQGSTVQVEYTGWIAKTGKKFDSSYDHGGTPFSLANVGQAQIIQGWNEGLIGMKAGGTRRLYIPPSLGYGAQGSPPVIPANADLIFDVTVLTVQ